MVKIPRKPDALGHVITGGKWKSEDTFMQDNAKEHETWHSDSAYLNRTTRFNGDYTRQFHISFTGGCMSSDKFLIRSQHSNEYLMPLLVPLNKDLTLMHLWL
jgi:hypothetical protein